MGFGVLHCEALSCIVAMIGTCRGCGGGFILSCLQLSGGFVYCAALELVQDEFFGGVEVLLEAEVADLSGGWLRMRCIAVVMALAEFGHVCVVQAGCS